MKLKNIKIGIRLWIAFGVLTAIMIVIFAIAFNSLTQLSKEIVNIGDNRIPDLIDFSKMNTERMNIRAETMEVFKCTGSDNCQLELAQIIEKRNKSWEIVDTYWSNITLRTRQTEKGRQLISQLTGEYKAWRDIYKELDAVILELKNASGKDEIEGLMVKYNNLYREMVPISDKMGQTFESALSNNMENTYKMITEEENLAISSKSAMSLAIVLAIIFTIIISTVIINSITRPLAKGVEFANSLSKGDLTVSLEVHQTDEIGILAESLQNMANKLKEVVESIMDGADNIADASQQMSSTSQQMSQGASEQASSTEEVSSSMEEMTSNIMQNTDNALQTDKISAIALEGVTKVGKASQESLVSIKEIAQKITIINDIAFQTNILALNAAVEAARAGEQGKGFAVVAAEVRKLAERSKIAADEIGVLSKTSVDVTEGAGKLMIELTPEIQKTAKLVQEIAAASQEQNNGADQINSAIQQLNTVTQQNAAAAEELASSSEELAGQAEQLKEIISFFSIGKTMQTKRTIKKEQNHSYKKNNGQVKQSASKQTAKKGASLNMFHEEVTDSVFEAI